MAEVEESARGMKLPSQYHFVLVHGAQHGAWCWFKTQELLEKSGQQVSAIDLVSAGASPVDADDVESFDHYSQPLYDLIESLPNENKFDVNDVESFDHYSQPLYDLIESLPNENKILKFDADNGESFDHYSQPLYGLIDSLPNFHKIILVGHSMGGTTIAQATERYPHKIHVAVYVSGSMYTSGMSGTEINGEVLGELAASAQYNFAKGPDHPPTSCWPAVEVVKRLYYSNCSPEDIEFAMVHLRRVPIMGDDATTFTEQGYHSVPRVYIRNSLDMTIKPQYQDLFISKNPPNEVLHIDSDHSPFLSAVKELHQHLLHVAETYSK